MFESLLDAEESALVEQIGALERLKSAAAADQARLTAELDTRRRADDAARGIPAGLARYIALRDDTQPDTNGGPTSELNGQGTREASTYAKELPGWRTRPWTTNTGIYVIDFTNPTTPAYQSTAPPLLGTPPPVATTETSLANHAAHHAARPHHT